MSMLKTATESRGQAHDSLFHNSQVKQLVKLFDVMVSGYSGKAEGLLCYYFVAVISTIQRGKCE